MKHQRKDYLAFLNNEFDTEYLVRKFNICAAKFDLTGNLKFKDFGFVLILF